VTRSAPILVFDGRCGFCTRSVEWALARLRAPLRAVPYQALDLAAHGLAEAEVRRAAQLLVPGRVPVGGHRAVAGVLLLCRAPWSALGRVMSVPPASWLAALGYRLVARFRRYLPGSTPACRRAWDFDAGRPA